MVPSTRKLTPAVFAVGVVIGTIVGVGFVTASTGAGVGASPNDPGAAATHRATATAGSCEAGDSLNKLRVDYSVGSEPADVSNVGEGDVQAVGIDSNGDGAIDTDVSDDLSSVSGSNDDHTLDVGFGGSYSLAEGDTVIIEFADVQNPSTAGTFDVDVSLNYQSDPICTSSTSLTIEGTDPDASVAADPSTAGDDATHTVNRRVGSDNQGASLTGFTVEYDSTDATGLSASDVSTVGLDTDGDGSAETDLSAELTGVGVSNGGATVQFSFDGSTTLESGDHLILTYGGVTNPTESGDYSVNTVLEGTSAAATLSVDTNVDLEPSASVGADPATAGATATHAATISLDESDVGDSLNKLRVDYSVGSEPADVSNVGEGDVQAVGIDSDGDGTIDTDVSDDLSGVSASNDGHTLDVGFGGSYSLAEGDTVIIEFAGVQNPSTSGTFDVDVSLNYQSDPVTRASATFSVTESTDGSDSTNDTDDTDGTSGTDEPDNTNGTDESGDTGNETTDRSTSLDLILDSASVDARPNAEAVGSATHVARTTVATGGETATLRSITIDYTVGADPADVGDFDRSHVQVVGVDSDGDGVAESTVGDAVSNVSASNRGETISVSFDGGATVQDGETLVLRYADVQNPAEEGTYDVGVTVEANDTRAAAVANLSIESATASDEPTVAVAGNGSTATAVIQGAETGDSASVDLDRAPDESGVTIDGVTFTFAERTNASFRIDADPSRPIDALGTDLDHFAIHHGPVNVSEAAIRFYVGNETLESHAASPEDVVLVRQHDGRWQELDTRLLGTADGAHRFAATAPGMSTFAVSSLPSMNASEPRFRVVETDLSTKRTGAGKRIRVTATVRNVGTGDGTFDANLTANGAVLARQQVRLDAGESDRVTLAHNVTEPAVYDVAVSGADAGAVEVNARDRSPAPSDPAPPQQESPFLPPALLGLLGTVGVSVSAAWFAAAR